MPTEIIDVHGHLPVGDQSVVDKMAQSLRANDVGKLFVSSLGRDEWLAFPDEKHVAEANEDAFDLCRRMPELFRGYAYLNPNIDSWEKELDKWVSSEFFIGIKLWTSLKDDDGSSDVCLPILRAAAAAGAPVLIHCCFRTGGTLERELGPVEIVNLARQVEDVMIIMAHMGGNWEKSLKAIADQPNIYVDTSGFPAFRGSVECAVRHCGPRRVLFGSDIPCRTAQCQLQRIYAADVPLDVKERILRENALSVFQNYFH